MIPATAFLDVGGFDTRYTIVEDWDLWLRLLHSKTGFVACQEPLFLYRIHPGAISRCAEVALEECFEIYRNRVLPYLPRRSRWIRYNRIRSEHEAVASMVLRSNGNPRSLPLLMVSIPRDPFTIRIATRFLSTCFTPEPAPSLPPSGQRPQHRRRNRRRSLPGKT